MNQKNLRFSIIMCCYNLGDLVKKSINSVLSQDFTNYELLLVNDGSSDNTLDNLKEFSKKDNKIVLINNEKNIGLSASRNKAISLARGEYIVHLDGDDTFYATNTLSRIDATLGSSTPDICYFGVQYIGGSNKVYIPNAQNSSREARITCDMHFAVASKVWKREFLLNKNLSFIEGMYYEDMVYSIKGAILANDLSFGSFPIYNYYRDREGSIMATPNIKRCKDMYKMLYYLMDLYEQTPEALKPYLLSFIENETLSVPTRLEAILKSLKDNSYTPALPKRNYTYLGDVLSDNETDSDESIYGNVIPIAFEKSTISNNNFQFSPEVSQVAANGILPAIESEKQTYEREKNGNNNISC